MGVIGESSSEKTVEFERDEYADEIGESPHVVAALVMTLTGRILVSRVSLCIARGFRGTGWMMWDAGRYLGGDCCLRRSDWAGEEPREDIEELGEGKRDELREEEVEEVGLASRGDATPVSRILRVMPRVGSLQVGWLGSWDSKYPSRT